VIYTIVWSLFNGENELAVVSNRVYVKEEILRGKGKKM